MKLSKGVVVETNALFVQGIFGMGGEKHGMVKFLVESLQELLTDDEITSEVVACIVVGGSMVTPEAFRKAEQVGVSGAIVGGI